MTRNDLRISAKRLRQDAEQLRGRQRSILKLGGGELKPRWEPEHDALTFAIHTLEASASDMEARGAAMDEEVTHGRA